MATVTTPNGERLEGVTGALLDYYRGEAATVGGYEIVDDEAEATPEFPVHHPPVVEQVEVPKPSKADAADPADVPPGPLDLH